MRATLTDESPTERPLPAQRATDAPPVVLDGRYELGELLGAGGMGVVYAARHTVLGTRLAVKVLAAGRGGRDLVRMERFVREAQAASAIGHRGIVEVRDVGVTAEGVAYFVMERLDGHDLSAELERVPALPVERAVRIAREICAAVGAAHEHGIVHRDLKPENVFLLASDPDPCRIKVLDFGVAKFPEREDGAHETPSALRRRVTAFGELVGTPVYMSPEQCAGAPVDPRSDVYALGVLLYEMVTGLVPFDGATAEETMRLHREAPPPSPAELAPQLPAALVHTILRCLAKSPDDRPASMAELSAELAPLAAEPATTQRAFRRPSAASPSPSRSPSPSPSPSRSPSASPTRPSDAPIAARAARSPAFALALLVALAVTCAWWLARGPSIAERAARPSTPSGPSQHDVARPSVVRADSPPPQRLPVSAAIAEPESIAEPEAPTEPLRAHEPTRAGRRPRVARPITPPTTEPPPVPQPIALEPTTPRRAPIPDPFMDPWAQ